MRSKKNSCSSFPKKKNSYSSIKIDGQAIICKMTQTFIRCFNFKASFHQCDVGGCRWSVVLSKSSHRRHGRHRQHNRHGIARRRNGETISSRTPNPAITPTTCSVHFQHERQSLVFMDQFNNNADKNVRGKMEQSTRCHHSSTLQICSPQSKYLRGINAEYTARPCLQSHHPAVFSDAYIEN